MLIILEVLFKLIDKLTSHFLSYNQQNTKESNQHWKVASFIDNVIVGTEKKEGHNEVVEKVVERLEENNLYVKL